MRFYVNDTDAQLTLMTCRCAEEAAIYASWANESSSVDTIRADTFSYPKMATGDELLRYFGFTVDSVVDLIFSLLPKRSRMQSNLELIKIMLHEPTQSKSQCCSIANKYPSHYSRLSNMLGQHCALIGELSGGRNPMKILRGIRGDL